jgi:site-specific DNA recombinase
VAAGQELLASKNQSGEKHRIHHHYLKGSLYCGGCGSRMVVSINRNRYGTRYPYFVCLGRHQKRTNCTLKYLRIETVEELVTEHYRAIQLTSAERELVEARLAEDFAAFREEVEAERQALEGQSQRLLAERTKLLQAHYADAVPLDLLRDEQARIAEQLDYINERLEAAGRQEAVVNFNLGRALELATNVYDTYRASDSARRRLLNQAFFKRLIVYTEDVRSEFAEPYDVLLSPQLRFGSKGTTTASTEVDEAKPAEPFWATWEAFFNKNEPPRPSGRRGSKDAILVGAGGFEPP